MKQLKKCPVCNSYTLLASCPDCPSQTLSAHPAKYSPHDKYAVYRRKQKFG